MKKAIVIISSVLSFLGLLSIFLYSFEYRDVIPFLSILPFRKSELLGEHFHHFGIIDFFFYLVFIVGIIVYVVSKYRETRLLLFMYSVILISKLVFIPFWIYVAYLSVKFRALHPELDSNFNLLHSILYYAFQILIIVVSFRIIKYLNSERELDFTEEVYGEHVSKIYVAATKEQRVFNYLVDTLVWFIVYASLFSAFRSLVNMYLQMDSTVLNNDSFESDSSKDFIVFLYLVLFRFVYYLFFELVFKSSPAKFLTETKVMDSVGEPTNFKEILQRNFYRNIPFNPITFLFGYNLHDNWSGTEVFQEKPVGVSGNKYIGHFFTIIILFGILYFGVFFYNNKH